MFGVWTKTERSLSRLAATADWQVPRAALGAALWFMILMRAAVAAEPPPRYVDAHAVLVTAQRYLGVPYRFGALGDALDCSGFVKRVFAEHGIDLPRTSAEMSTVGKKVSWDALAPGDLVFFHTGDKSARVSHVGIALGHGKMIHASTSRQRISIDSLDLAYYRSRRAVARRLPIEQPPALRTAQLRPATSRELLHMPRQL